MTTTPFSPGTALPPIDVRGRADALWDRVGSSARGDLDALVIADLTNLRWLTGFSGSNGWAVVSDAGVTIITDGRYGEQAERQMASAGCAGSVAVGRTAADLLHLLGTAIGTAARVGFESAHTSHQRFQQLGEHVVGELVPTVGLVEQGRRHKDAAELARIAHACAIADEALRRVAPTIVPGVTEAQVRNDLESTMRDLGADGPSYETIVATGPVNAPLPHHRPTATPIEAGHTVVIDVGALVEGYHSDMTRTFVVGEPSSLQLEVYEVVLAAQRAGVSAVRPGLLTRDLDAACRQPIAAAGFGPWFSHGTGHGVGLLIHEDPFVNSAGAAPPQGELQVGDVVTVEPGVYRGDFGGVRIEDLVEVTSNGCRVLTASPKDAPCLPSAPTT